MNTTSEVRRLRQMKREMRQEWALTPLHLKAARVMGLKIIYDKRRYLAVNVFRIPEWLCGRGGPETTEHFELCDVGPIIARYGIAISKVGDRYLVRRFEDDVDPFALNRDLVTAVLTLVVGLAEEGKLRVHKEKP